MLKSDEKNLSMPHHLVPPHHTDPLGRHHVISVLYDSKKNIFCVA